MYDEDCKHLPAGRQTCPKPYVDFGIADPSRNTIDWVWRKKLDAKSVLDATFADLGGGIAIVYRPPGSLFGWEYDGFFVEFSHTNTKPVPLCDRKRQKGCSGEIITLAVVDGRLHAVLGPESRSGYERSYTEFVVSEDGSVEMRPVEHFAKTFPGSLGSPCVSQGADGSVSVALPYTKTTPPGHNTALASHPMVYRLDYPRAHLPQGPHLWSTRTRPCPTEYDSATGFHTKTRLSMIGLRRWDPWASRASVEKGAQLFVYMTGHWALEQRALHIERARSQ